MEILDKQINDCVIYVKKAHRVDVKMSHREMEYEGRKGRGLDVMLGSWRIGLFIDNDKLPTGDPKEMDLPFRMIRLLEDHAISLGMQQLAKE